MNNILIVDEMYIPMVGGIQNRTKNFCEEWLLSGNQVSLYTIDHLGNLPLNENIEGVNVMRIHSDKDYYRGGRFGRKLSTIFIYTFKLLLRIQSFKGYNIIIFNQFPVLPTLVIPFILRFIGFKGTIVLDFVEFRTNIFWDILQRLMFASVDKVVCISNYIYKETLKYNAVIKVINNSVELKRFDSCLKRKDYIFIGRMEKHKHPELAIEAILLLRKDSNDIKLRLVGDGSIFKELKEKYESDCIIFYGYLDDISKNSLLKSSRVLLLPSEREGLPTVGVEAMASHVPLLTTDFKDNGTKHFVIDEKIGLVSLPNSIDIARSIILIEKKYSIFVDNCKSSKLKYDLERNSELYLKFCLEND